MKHESVVKGERQEVLRNGLELSFINKITVFD